MQPPDFSEKTDDEIRSWIRNHEEKKATGTPLYHALLEEDARRREKHLKIEASLLYLMSAARAGRFTSYGELAAASNTPWNIARHQMNGAGGHLDQLLNVCHSRGLPLLSSICVNQEGLRTGALGEEALAGFIKGAIRLGYSPTDWKAFLKSSQDECFAWGRKNPG
jgi:5-methylcytosine-specific restriction protein B